MGRLAPSALLVFALAGALPDMAAAQDRSIAATALIAERTPLDQIRRTDWSRDSAREAVSDWETGGFAIGGGRAAEGRKRVEFLTPAGTWRRSYHGEARVWAEVGEGIALEAGFAVARESNGRIDAALLTESSRGSSASASLAVRGDSGAALRLSLFDRDGWDGVNVADTVNRMNNAEGPARSGVSLALALGDAANGDDRWALTLERAAIAGGENANAARIETRMRF